MQQQTISRSNCDVWHNVDFIWQPTQWLDQEEAPKLFPKPNLHQKKKKKVMVTHGLVVRCPSDPLQFSEFWWTHYIWELCSANWWDAPKTAIPAAAISQQKGPNSSPWQRLTLRPTTNASKIERIRLRSFASSTIFTWPLANWLTLLQASWQLFAGKPAGGRKCFPRVHRIPKHGFLLYRNNQTFLVSKNVLIVMVLILLNEDVFEPSYNDLKFMVWNSNYVFTHLIVPTWGC